MSYAFREDITGSSNLNVSVDATSYYTGSSIKAEGRRNLCVGGLLVKTGTLGSSGKLYMAISFDNVNWNYFYKETDISSGSRPYVITDSQIMPSYIAPVILNSSGSAISGSVWVRAYRF